MSTHMGGAVAIVVRCPDDEDVVVQHLQDELTRARIEARADAARLMMLGAQAPFPLEEYVKAADAAALSHARLAGFAKLLLRRSVSALPLLWAVAAAL